MQKRRQPSSRFIRASASNPRKFTITSQAADLDLSASEAPVDGQKPKLRTFSMTAYTGGPMPLAGFYYPVIVDLAGMSVPNQARPILYSHDRTQIVGHSEKISVSARTIKVSGKISGIGDAAQQVTALADNGFPWQSSIGAESSRIEFVERGAKVKVNGMVFDGPVYVARQTSLREISFAALGADDNTSASVAATYEDGDMNFTEWLKAAGFVESDLSETQIAKLRAAYDAESDEQDDDDPVPRNKNKITAGLPDVKEQLKEYRTQLAAESKRVTDIQAACDRYNVTTVEVDGKQVNLAAHAIENEWSPDKAELYALRASRPKAPSVHIVPKEISNPSEVIEAAMLINCSFPNVEKKFKPEVLEAADKHYRRIGLQQVLLMAACANGFVARAGESIHQGNLREVLEFAFPTRQIAAASTLNVSNLLTNVANKELLAGYMEDNEEWREISAIKSVSDFKQATSYRLLDNFEYEELPPDGQIKHGTLGEESYTRQAKTYAKMFALTRTDIINDDLGAFDDLRNRLGRGAKKKFNNIFWAAFMNNASFFTAGRGNYITGSTTNLGLDGVGLELGVTAFRKLKSPAADGSKKVGNSVGGRPDRMLIPPELEFTGGRLYASQYVTGGSATVPDANIHVNKYRPIVVDWLSDSNFTGYSATAWYLLRNPLDLAAMVVSFLNGQQNPTIEVADADFNTLGVQMRGYHDWGCDQAEYLAGVKSKGAA